MAGYWKIDKDWVLKDGLTATEAVVLADIMSWQGIDGQGVTLAERARRCGITKRWLIKVLARLKEKGIDTQKGEQNSPREGEQNSPNEVNKIHQKRGTKFTERDEQSSLPPTPPIYVEEHRKKKEERGKNAHARVSTPPDTHDEGQEAAQRLADNESRHRILSAGIMRGWVAHWEQELGFQPHLTHSVTSEVNDLEPTIARLMVADGYVIDEDTVAAYTQQLFSAMRQKADDWQRAKWSLAVINKQFDTFIDRLKNGTTATANNSRRYTGTLAAMRDEIAADLAAGK